MSCRGAASPATERKPRAAVGAIPMTVNRLRSTMSHSRPSSGKLGQSLDEHNAGAELEDADDHQGAQHPAHVRDPSNRVGRLDVEGVAEIHRRLDEIADMAVHDALGAPVVPDV